MENGNSKLCIWVAKLQQVAMRTNWKYQDFKVIKTGSYKRLLFLKNILSIMQEMCYHKIEVVKKWELINIHKSE